MSDAVVLVSVVVVATSSVFSAFALAWLCGKVSAIVKALRGGATTSGALTRLEAASNAAVEAAKEAVRVAERTSAQVDVVTELGHQSAESDRHVASDLAASIRRADVEETGEPGAAADAGLKSEPGDEQ